MTADQLIHDPLLAGFYSTGEAARLLGLPGGTKVRGWLNGWGSSRSGPIVNRDFKDTSTVSFLDLMEMRFIEFFRSQGVSMQTLRKAADRARLDWGENHPLALSKAKYLTDRRRVFAQVAEETGDSVTWDLASGQHQMWVAIENAIAKGVVFDPVTHLASRWFPRAAEFPKVVVDPRIAFGRPAIDEPGVPTAALFRQWKAEKGDSSRVARWFNVSTNDVDSAVEFEIQTSS